MENSVGAVLRAIGIIVIVLGFIGSVIILVTLSDTPLTNYAFIISIAAFLSSFISGMLFVGFGEIIALLQNLNDKFDAKTNEQPCNKPSVQIKDNKAVISVKNYQGTPDGINFLVSQVNKDTFLTYLMLTVENKGVKVKSKDSQSYYIDISSINLRKIDELNYSINESLFVKFYNDKDLKDFIMALNNKSK